MSLDQIVNVTITKETTAITQTGFGTPMVLTYHTRFVEKARVFNDAPSMLAAAGGPFQSTDMAYQLSVKVFSQNPRPPQIVVGRREFPTIRTVDIVPIEVGVIGTPDGLPRGLQDYTITLNGVDFTFTTDGTPTRAEITAGLTALINGGSVDVKATDVGSGDSIKIEKADGPGGTPEAGDAFSLEYDRSLMTSNDDTIAAAGGTLADDIAAIQAVSDDWYGIVGDWFGAIEITAVSSYIEGTSKIHSATSQDDDILTSAVDDIGSTLKAAAYNRSWVNYHQTPHAGISPGEFGKNLPTTPGSITWKFRTLAGIAASVLTANEIVNLQAKNVGFYREVQGVNITCDGKAASGQFIDTQRLCDWLKARIQESVFSLFVNQDKIAYTDEDLGLVDNAIRGVLSLGVSNNAIAPDPEFTVTVPKAVDIAANSKANRVLPDVEFEAVQAGAVHSAVINGRLTL